MNYRQVIVHFTNGKSVDFNYVREMVSTDDEYRFEGQHYESKYTVLKRNVNYIERMK